MIYPIIRLIGCNQRFLLHLFFFFLMAFAFSVVVLRSLSFINKCVHVWKATWKYCDWDLDLIWILRNACDPQVVLNLVSKTSEIVCLEKERNQNSSSVRGFQNLQVWHLNENVLWLEDTYLLVCLFVDWSLLPFAKTFGAYVFPIFKLCSYPCGPRMHAYDKCYVWPVLSCRNWGTGFLYFCCGLLLLKECKGGYIGLQWPQLGSTGRNKQTYNLDME